MASTKGILNLFNTKSKSFKGSVGYDNPRENIDPHIKTKVISTKEIVGNSAKIFGGISGAWIWANAISGSNLYGAVIRGSAMTLTGNMSALNATITQRISGGNIFSSGAISGTSLFIRNNISGGSLKASTISGTNLYITNNISGANFTGNTAVISQTISGAVFYGWGITPIGSITAWLKSFTGTPALPSGWVECNGQTLSDAESVYNGQTIPNLNGSSSTKRFLRGSTTSGTSGGSETHLHALMHCHAFLLDPEGYVGGGTCFRCGGNTAVCNGDSASASTLPSYYEVVWIMRIK